MQLECIVDVVSLNGIGIFKRNSILETTNKAIIKYIIAQKWFAQCKEKSKVDIKGEKFGVGKTVQQKTLDEIVIPPPASIKRRKGL